MSRSVVYICFRFIIFNQPVYINYWKALVPIQSSDIAKEVMSDSNLCNISAILSSKL